MTLAKHLTRGSMSRTWMIAGATAVVLVAALIAAGPSERVDWRRWQFRGRPDVYAAASAWIDARDTVQRLRREYEVADSRARARAVRLPAGEPGIAVIAGEGVTPAAREAAAASVRDELAALGRTRVAYPVAVVLAVDTLGPRTAFYRRATVLPSAPGEPCTVVLHFDRQLLRWPARLRERFLGTCGFFAAHGAPGAGMLAWLRESGMRTADVSSPLPGAMSPEPVSLGLASAWPMLASCRAGSLTSCQGIFDGRSTWGFYGEERADSLPASDVAVGGPLLYNERLHRVSRGALAELHRHLGDERFGELWRDARGPSVALEAMTGQDGGAWMKDVVAAHVAPYRAGPALPMVPFAATLLLIGGAGAWSVLGARRRTS